MFKLTNLRLPGFFALAVLLLGVQASAQFEVSPDHFDSSATKQAQHRRPTTKGKANAANQAPKTAAVATRHKGSTQKNKGVVSKSQAAGQQTVAAVSPR